MTRFEMTGICKGHLIVDHRGRKSACHAVKTGERQWERLCCEGQV